MTQAARSDERRMYSQARFLFIWNRLFRLVHLWGLENWWPRLCRKWIPPLWSNSPVRDDITLCVSSDWLWAGCQVISASVLLVVIMGHTLFIGQYDNTNSLILGVLSCNSLRWFAYYHSLVNLRTFLLETGDSSISCFSLSRHKQPTRTIFYFAEISKPYKGLACRLVQCSANHKRSAGKWSANR